MGIARRINILVIHNGIGKAAKMLSYLKKHWATEEMANAVGFSQSHFYHTYRSLYGVSPTNDIINARIEKAKHMLFYERIDVREIAEKLGYENTTHFIRQFKAKTGFSPTKYKNTQIATALTVITVKAVLG